MLGTSEGNAVGCNVDDDINENDKEYENEFAPNSSSNEETLNEYELSNE